eukprot:c16420_g1_i1 orf=101-1417(+)
MVSSLRERSPDFQAPHCPAALPASQPAAPVALQTPPSAAFFPALPAPPSAAPQPQDGASPTSESAAIQAHEFATPQMAPHTSAINPQIAVFPLPSEPIIIPDEASIIEAFLASLEGRHNGGTTLDKKDEDSALHDKIRDTISVKEDDLAPAPLMATQERCCPEMMVSTQVCRFSCMHRPRVSLPRMPQRNSESGSVFVPCMSWPRHQWSHTQQRKLTQEIFFMHADKAMETWQFPQRNGSKECIGREPLLPTQTSGASTKVSSNSFLHTTLQLHDIYPSINLQFKVMHFNFNCIDTPSCMLMLNHITLNGITLHIDQITTTTMHALIYHIVPTLHVSMLESMHVSPQTNVILMNVHAYTLIQHISLSIIHTINHGLLLCMSFAITCLHVSPILTPILKSSIQECFLHAYHASHQASCALNKPHYNLEPNLSYDPCSFT